jgi:hypothetical protein
MNERTIGVGFSRKFFRGEFHRHAAFRRLIQRMHQRDGLAALAAAIPRAGGQAVAESRADREYSTHRLRARARRHRCPVQARPSRSRDSLVAGLRPGEIPARADPVVLEADGTCSPQSSMRRGPAGPRRRWWPRSLPRRAAGETPASALASAPRPRCRVCTRRVPPRGNTSAGRPANHWSRSRPWMAWLMSTRAAVEGERAGGSAAQRRAVPVPLHVGAPGEHEPADPAGRRARPSPCGRRRRSGCWKIGPTRRWAVLVGGGEDLVHGAGGGGRAASR